jgi:hypothetical protein
MTTKETKAQIIQNFILHSSIHIDEPTLDRLNGMVDTYVEEDHVDEIGQAFPSTVMTERDIAVERLGQYISDDANESYDKLVKQSGIDGSVMADDIVLMWEPLEDRYTVDQLLDEI